MMVYLGEKSYICPAGLFFHVLQNKCLLKCTYYKKPPLT